MGKGLSDSRSAQAQQRTSFMKIGIVLAYGHFNPDKPEHKSYRNYLDFVAEEIDKRRLEKVILCGGFTVPEINDSEAGTCQKYLLEAKPEFTNYILEDQSLTTNQNLQFAAQKIKFEDELVVFGDLTRLPKISWAAMHYLVKASQDEIYQAVHKFTYAKDLHKQLPGEFIYQNLTVVGFDFNRGKEETIRQIFASPLDILALYDEKNNQIDVEQRKKDLHL